jgi:hypothetical protein
MVRTFTGKLLIIATSVLIILIISSDLPHGLSQTPAPTQSPTPFIPVARGTPLPPIIESITTKTAKSIILLARWKNKGQPDKFISFSPDNQSLYVGRQMLRAVDGITAGVLEENPPAYYRNAKPLQSTSPDGRFSADRFRSAIKITNLESPTTSLYYSLEGTREVYFFPDGRYLLVTFSDGQIWFVAADSWEQQLLGVEEESTYSGSDLHPDLVIDIGDKAPLEIFVSSDLSTMAILLQTNTFDPQEHIVQLWRVADLSLITTIKSPKRPIRLAFSPDGGLLAGGSEDNHIYLWDTQTGQLSAVLEGDPANFNALAFAPNGRLLASMDDEWLSIWGVLPDLGSPATAGTATAMARLNPTATRTPVLLPKATPTPTSSLPVYEDVLPMAWPVTMPTDKQIEEVKSCSVEELAETRYPESMPYGQLESGYPVHSACDWAALAVAYYNHFESEDSMTEEGKRAFIQAVLQNPAYAFKMPLFYMYFGCFNLAAPPPFAGQPITSLTIDYEWSGMGEPSYVKYHINITQANSSKEKIQITLNTQPGETAKQANHEISPSLVQAIRPALMDFLPVGSPFELGYCSDNYPQWQAKLTFLDGTKITLDTHNSNLFHPGGPWQTQIDGQNYLQFSPALLGVFTDLLDALNLPLGQPMSAACHADDVFDLAYP